MYFIKNLVLNIFYLEINNLAITLNVRILINLDIITIVKTPNTIYRPTNIISI